MARTKDELRPEVLAAFETLERAVQLEHIDGWRAQLVDDDGACTVLCVSVANRPLGGESNG